LGVERGWLASIQEIFRVFITGGPLHFMFHIQTKANYMSQTILVGGAKYRPTGRGFVTQHTPFDEQYRIFASSHLYLGVELAAGLILMGVYTHAGQYFGRTWSLWLASASFLCSPFWFNPLTFDWTVVINDYDLWLKWIRCTSGGSSKSWSMWYNEENAFYKGLPIASKLVYMIKITLNLLVAVGIRRSDLFKSDVTLNTPVVGAGTILSFLAILLLFGRLFSARERTMPYPVRRTIGIMLFMGMVVGIVTLFLEDKNYIRFALAGYYGMGALCLFGLLFGVKFVKPFYLVHDIVCGHLIFAPLFLLAALQLPGLIQTWLLYHNALSTDVVVSDILRYARKSQESGSGENTEDLLEQISDLRRLVQKQEQILVNAGFSNGETNFSTAGSVVEVIMSPSPEPPVRSASSIQPVGRALSMSGLDVWGNMALGDVQGDEFKFSQISSGAQSNTGQDAIARSQYSHGFSFTQPDTMPPR
jgi:callose synthase